MKNLSNSEDSYYEIDDAVNINVIFRILLRSKNLLITTTFFLTSLIIASSYLIKPVYRGSLKMVTGDDKSVGLLNAPSFLETLSGGEFSSSKNSTELLILKSPSVLNEVFIFHKNYLDAKEKSNSKTNKNNSKKGLQFDDWLKSFEIKFTRGTDIVNVDFKHSDKKHILNVLKLIQKSYEEYSVRERIENLEKLNFYLVKQKEVLKDKSSKSLKELNEFSIKYGLGNIDGFVDLALQSELKTIDPDLLKGKGVIDDKSLKELINQYDRDKSKSKESNAGQRYDNQRRLLEEYEAQYNDLQAFLKPNSKTIKNLKSKIDNLKTRLKRPNEILIKYRELSSKAERDEQMFFNLENNLSTVNLEIAREETPWKTITQPYVYPIRVSPNRKQIAVLGFLASLFFISSYIIYREKSSGIIYEFDELRKQIKLDHYLNITGEDLNLDIKLIRSFINKDLEKFSITDLSKDKIKIISIFNKEEDYVFELARKIEYKFITLDSKEIEDASYLIFILKTSNISNKDIEKINNYVQIYKDKIYGWINIGFN